MLNFYRTKQQDTALLKREIYTFVLDSSRPRNQKFIKTVIKPRYILQKKETSQTQVYTSNKKKSNLRIDHFIRQILQAYQSTVENPTRTIRITELH